MIGSDSHPTKATTASMWWFVDEADRVGRPSGPGRVWALIQASTDSLVTSANVYQAQSAATRER